MMLPMLSALVVSNKVFEYRDMARHNIPDHHACTYAIGMDRDDESCTGEAFRGSLFVSVPVLKSLRIDTSSVT